jgi:hypothetical protein
MLTVQATLAAPDALAALERGRNWTALQVYLEACILGDDSDRLVALVRPAVGVGPFSIVVEISGGFTDYLKPGDSFESCGDLLAAGGLEVRLEGAARWQPRPPWEALRAAGSLLRWRDELAARLRAQAPADSLADGLEALLGGRPLERASGDRLEQEVLSRAVEAGSRLVQSLARADLPAAGRAAAVLAGLGSGLTPAGDDFLVGVMLALWSTAEPAWARQCCQVLLEAAGARTHRISRAWLRAAADGEATEAWHALATAMLGSRAAAVQRAADRILRQGHTSGADALTGCLALANKTAPEIGAV